MMFRFFAAILLIGCLSAKAAEKFCDGVRSIEQILDDGRMAAIVQAKGKTDERCHSGILVESASKSTVLFDSAPMNVFGTDFYKQCRIMAGRADGSVFWCISNDTISGVLTRDRLHVQDNSSARALPDNLPGNGLYLSNDGVHAAIFSAPASLIFGTIDGVNFTEEFTVELEGVGNTAFRPALTGDLSVVYYLSESAMQSLELRRYDVATGETSLIENIGVADHLGLHEGGMYLSEKTALACSADGCVVAYPYYLGGTNSVNCLRTASRGQGEVQWSFENVTETLGEEPSVSSDGRFVAFRIDGAVCRYDTVKKTLECVSEGIGVDYGAPAISPSGRYVAFIDAEARLWRADCGGCLSYRSSDVYGLPQADGSRVDIGIGVLGFRGSEADIIWEFVGEDGTLHGRMLDINGNEILPDERYSAETFPWSVETDGTQGDCEIRVSLFLCGDDELVDSHVSRIVISDFRCLTEDLAETSLNYIYRSLHFQKNGLLAFSTNLGLVDSDTDFIYNVYSVNTENLRISYKGMPRCMVVNGNAETSYWVDDKGRLYSGANGEPLLEGVSTAAAKPAVSSDGATVAVEKDGAVYYSADFGESFMVLSASGNAPCISADGSAIAWLEAGKVMLRVGNDGIYAWDEAAGAICEQRTSCLEQCGGNVVSLYGVSANGRSLLFKRSDSTFALCESGMEKPLELPIPANATDAVLSANGRRVAYIARISGDGTSRLYYIDLDKDTLTPVCTMPDAQVGTSRDGSNANAGYLAISGDARQIAFASYGDMVNGGVKKSDNAPCRLYVWNDKAWTNAVPSFANTSLACAEDSVNCVLPVECTQDDADDLSIRLLTPPAHGTATMVATGVSSQPYSLCYTPKKNFVGMDAVRLLCTDGSASVEAEFTINVENVNDAPVWNVAQISEVVFTAGETLDVPLYATDVDLRNPIPDSLEYSLGEKRPEWCRVDTISDEEGVLTLSPRLAEVGEHIVEVIVSDGIVKVPFEISVKVDVPAPITVSAALLLDSSLAPSRPASYGDWLLTWCAGCWENLRKGFQTLSLPGDAEITQICHAFGVDCIYVYDDELGYRACKTGILSAGSGFWVYVHDAPEGEITLQPKPRAEMHRFVGPIWEDNAPEGLHFSVSEGAYLLSHEWQIGRAYFVNVE